MSVNIPLLISIICAIVTCTIAIMSYNNNSNYKENDEITDRVKRDTAISTKLDMVIAGNGELKSDIKTLNSKIDDISERVARCEEKTTNAHDRIDKLEIKFNQR